MKQIDVETELMDVICDVHGGAARSGYLGNVAMEVIERDPRL